MKDFMFADTYLYKLHLLTNNLDKVLDQTLSSQCEITLSQFVLLLSVREKGFANQREVARFLMLSPAAVSRQVEVLRKRDWLDIAPSAKNRRDTVLSVTEKGLKVIEAGHAELEAHIFQIFDDQDRPASLMQHIDGLLSGIEGVSQQRSSERIKALTKELRHERRKVYQYTKS